ncbi:MAG TPA: sugar ABC transporter permease [Candidatus Ruania gallistercoris]|uniref:Sugar ABC transporter permease n=1 Tax=Candidatus Ruania gallistercoris TaxID=2838746 RepID=A0A9D2EEM4_9MICO|nr:sugar ABC transporter permease [Candidatus Ruania gallistercoris]
MTASARSVGPVLRGRRTTPWLLLAPALFFVALLFVIPFLYNVYVSFFHWSVIRPATFAGLSNYAEVLGSDRLYNAFGNTVWFAVLTVPIGVALALALALAFNRLVIRAGTSVIRALYFAPVVASLTAVAFVWLWIFNPSYGLANALLEAVGISGQSWLTSESQVIPSLAIMHIWARLGFNMIILLAGLNAIDPSYYEAARLDGAGPWRMLRSITIPLLNRQLVLVIAVETMTALKLFELPFAATKGGPVGASTSMVMEIYEQAFRFDRWGVSAVYVLILFVFIMVVTGVLRKVLSRDVSEA